MEQTTEQLNKADLRTDLETRYGGVMGSAIYDQLTRVQTTTSSEPTSLEVLQLSEIAHRLRAHVRGLIQHYRSQGGVSKNWSQNMMAIFDGSGTKGEIFRAYRLYKKMNRDFHAVYKECMTITEAHELHGIPHWYNARVSNDHKINDRMY